MVWRLVGVRLLPEKKDKHGGMNEKITLNKLVFVEFGTSLTLDLSVKLKYNTNLS